MGEEQVYCIEEAQPALNLLNRADHFPGQTRLFKECS